MTYDVSSTSTATIREWKDLDDTTPVWFMDIDGVLNALGYGLTSNREGSASPYHLDDFISGEMGHWSRYRDLDFENLSEDEWKQMATDEHAHSRYPISWNPDVTNAIRELHDSGRVRIVWMTTWGTGANYELGPLIGWPELEVIADPPSVEGQNDRLNGRWWKSHWVRAYVEASSASKFIWTDDDMRIYTADAKWANSQPNMLAIAPDYRTGITPAEMQQVEQFLSSTS